MVIDERGGLITISPPLNGFERMAINLLIINKQLSL